MRDNDLPKAARSRENILKINDKWDCISFNREAGYYDMWALSFIPYVYSFNHFVDALNS